MKREAERGGGQRDCPPINPCNEMGRYGQAWLRPSLIGRRDDSNLSPKPGIHCPRLLDHLLNPVKYIGVPEVLQPGKRARHLQSAVIKSPGENTLFVSVLPGGE